jgi:Na+/H+ antiporter NhaD/arsenite permease-like protein
MAYSDLIENQMNDAHNPTGSSKLVLLGVGVLIAIYLVALRLDLPQQATAMIVAAGAEHSKAEQSQKATADKTGEIEVNQPPPLWMVLPFALMLGVIAIFPLLHGVEHWWESNLHRFYVAAALAAITLGYYFWFHKQPIEAHWPAHHVALHSESGPSYALTWDVFANAMLNEYIPFIVLLFSLYVISGGIRIEGDLRAHSLTNAMFLLVGGVLASFIGTTGAAMLLIRPLLETNSERKHVVHTVIFFIFVVCNCGGCLLPLGDPPLFLGYLLGVHFLYTISLWKEWLFVNGLLIVIYYCWDRFWHYPHEEIFDIVRDETQLRPLTFSGLWPNVFLLFGVVLSVALLDPGKSIPGTDWHPWLYLREMAQLFLVAFSLALGSRRAREDNDFNYAAIIEVAALFFGIFITMQPALQILAIRGPSLGLTEQWHFFWAAGGLSSVLDNAPTYVVFFTTAQALTAKLALHNPIAGVSEPLLAAISLGSVFMGANTYIGNGPNFMVKAIAEKSGVKMPGFFGYMLYSGAILIPIFILTTFLFF